MSTNYDLATERITAIANERAFVPDDTWPIVKQWSVSATADFIVTRVAQATHGPSQFLLAKRAEPPWKGQWFVPGGRIKPGETSEQACRRNVKRELGFEPKEIYYVGEMPVYNPDSPEGVDWFSLWHLYEVRVEINRVFRPNQENIELGWFEKINPVFPEPVQQGLKMMGFSSE